MNQFPLLLGFKLTQLKNNFKKWSTGSRSEVVLLIFFFAAAGTGLFFFFFYSFRFFKGNEPFGPILIDESFYLFNFALFVMLLISAGVSAYASLFRSSEIPFLITKPISWSEIYFIKLTETIWISSWGLVFIVLPFMTAYGINKEVSLFAFPFLCFLYYLPFAILACTLGMLFSNILIWFLPSKKRRQTAFLFTLFIVVLWFMRASPELIKEQGSIAGILSGYLPHVAFVKNPFLPSYWITQGMLKISQYSVSNPWPLKDGLFYFLVLLSNTLFFFIPSYSVGKGLYATAYLKMQDHQEMRRSKRLFIRTQWEKILDRLRWPSKPALAYFEKDIKTFARDPSEWSQLIIFFGLLLLYFSNLRNLEFHVLKSFWKNIVFVLNTVGTYIVLSSFSMRFIFPMLSLEGSRAWIMGIAPIRASSILLVKFFLGTTISALLTMPLVFFSGCMLEVPLDHVLFTTGLGFFVCVALTGLSVGFGAKFPNFKSTNPSEIISGFGGSLLLMVHLSYLAFIGGYLALFQGSHMIVFATVAATSLLVGALPLKIGVKALERLEF